MKLKKSKKNSQLELSGVVDAYTVEELANALRDALLHAQPLRIDIAAVTRMDTAALQALLVAQQAFAVAELPLTLEGAWAGDVHAALTRLGLSGILQVEHA